MKKIKASDYIKVVEWSEEDQCFIGSAPPLIGPSCHGKKEENVYRQLCRIVEEWVDLYNKEGRTLPSPGFSKEYSGKFVLRVGSELHHLLAIRAMQEGDSLNNYCARLLKKVAP
ncbi:MAG: toxin-antitoxin system HicB family antitoxin [Methylacidiphilales bacterium]|nr:toxin-antitoxin system HicB family antitoxin [Candidatus Methylacidiphilales bacterium]